MWYYLLILIKNNNKKQSVSRKNCKPSLLDVNLINAKTNCIRPQNFATGVSDCHKMIGSLINIIIIPKFEKSKMQYKSFRTLDVHALNNDLQILIQASTYNHTDSNSEWRNNLC